MTATANRQQQQPRSAASWRESAMARSEIITDAWEVTKTYAGRIAEWVLFGCMIMNIIEILPGVTLWPALSNVVLGTQVVMLDVGGFSLASMGDHARQQGDERAARRASLTGGFLIAIMILTLLLVSIGLLWPSATSYTNVAEKGLILVRVIMTVIYGHVIHSLRRVGTQPTPAQVEALAAAFNQQLQQLASELARVQENVHRRLASELATQRASLQQQLAAELSPLHESLRQYEEALASIPVMQAQLRHLESSTLAETHKRPERPVLRALPPAQQQQGDNQDSRTRRVKETHQVPLQAATAEKFDARSFVFACLKEKPTLKLAEIEQRALACNQELSQSTASRYRKQFFASRASSTMQGASTHESSTMQAASVDASTSHESSAIDERRVVGE